MINKTIRVLMVDREINQRRLAELCDVSQSFLSRVLRGRSKSRPLKKKAAVVLGISTQRLARLLRA